MAAPADDEDFLSLIEADEPPADSKKDRNARRHSPPKKKRRTEAAPWRPTHFLSLRLTGERVLAFEMLQKRLVAQCPRIMRMLTPSSRAHVTLFVMRLSDDETIARATALLSSAEVLAVLARATQSDALPELLFKGLGRFSSRVLYVPPAPGPHLESVLALSRDLRNTFSSAFGDSAMGDGPFGDEPQQLHCTVAKMKFYGTKRRCAIYDAAALCDVESGAVLGVQQFASVELCAMQGAADDGYYRVVAAAPFVLPQVQSAATVSFEPSSDAPCALSALEMAGAATF